MRLLVPLALLNFFLVSLSSAAVLFDTDTGNYTTGIGGNGGSGQRISVTNAVTLSQIGFYMDLPDGGNVKFLIWDNNNDNLLFSIAEPVAPSNTISLLLSPTFTFNLAAGTTYTIGFVSDASVYDLSYFYPPMSFSQNGLTSTGANVNYFPYDNPTFISNGGASLALQLDGTSVPEPRILGLLVLGIPFVVRRMRRR